MYSVESSDEALDQIAALPPGALPFYAELMATLELAPWSGEAYNRWRPEANMRSHDFGDDAQGFATYLILERQRRVIVVRVVWAG